MHSFRALILCFELLLLAILEINLGEGIKCIKISPFDSYGKINTCHKILQERIYLPRNDSLGNNRFIFVENYL